MNSKELENWQSTRAKGKARYALLNGLVFFGLIYFGVSMSLTNDYNPVSVALSLIVCSALGYVSGLGMWFLQESRFKAHETNED